MAQHLDREQSSNERPIAAETKETGRIEAFSDGVFAIAITLLILEVGKPNPQVDAAKLITELLGLWPQFVAYGVSFLTILIMWVNHHALFRLICRTDRLFMVLNGLLLMMITFINYPTAVFADQLQDNFQRPEGAQVALAFYSGTFVVIAVLYNRMWWYAAHRGHLLLPDVEQQVKQIDRQFVFGPLLYVVAFALASSALRLSPSCSALAWTRRSHSTTRFRATSIPWRPWRSASSNAAVVAMKHLSQIRLIGSSDVPWPVQPCNYIH